MNRLREYQRGTLAAGGASISSNITLPGTFEMYSWNLDSVGNWKKTTQTPVAGSETTEVRQHNKLHQIVKVGATDCDYDTSGNMIDDGSRLLAYDAMNRVKTITRKSDSAVLGTYTYDAFGRRIQKVANSTTTDYLYDGMQCIEERVSDSMTKQYVWALYIDELLQINLADSSKYYPLQDLLYRTNALTDGNGSITEKYDTDAYGKTLLFDSNEQSITNPTCEFLFTGRRYDSESELYFYRARYYNPELGRFISKDPMDYVNSMSPYEYVLSMPIISVDPTGLTIAHFDDCNEKQKTALRAAHDAVAQRLPNAKKMIDKFSWPWVLKNFIEAEKRDQGSGEEPRRRQLVYDNHRRNLQVVLKKMIDTLNSGIGFECECDCKNDRIAYVYAFWSDIHFCPSFFKSSSKEQSETLLHELSHKAADTEDYKLQWWNKSNSDFGKAHNDAYFIQEFMHTKALRVERSWIWFWIWPRQK